MPTSSTYSFEVSRDQIISDALANVGAIGPGETATGAIREHAARTLNRLAKSIDPDGGFLWRIVRRTASTTSGTATFTPAADVIAVDEPMSYLPAASATSRTTIRPMSRDEFMGLADRTTPGVPRLFFIERTLSGMTVTLWPVPDTTGDTIEYAASVRGRDFSTGANTPDFPPEWSDCLVHGLSASLAPAYNQPDLAAYFRGLYEADKARLIQADTEHGDLVLVPFGRSY